MTIEPDDGLDIPDCLKVSREARAAAWLKCTPRDMVTGSVIKRDWRRPLSLTDEEWQAVLDAEARAAASKREAKSKTESTI